MAPRRILSSFYVFYLGYCEFGCQYQSNQLPGKTHLLQSDYYVCKMTRVLSEMFIVYLTAYSVTCSQHM